jgi:hypothetical protein
VEFLLVVFPTKRGVRVDGAVQGWTNVVLQLEAGEYDVTLEPPKNFSPVSQHISLENTAPVDPYRIKFNPLPASAIPPSPGSGA